MGVVAGRSGRRAEQPGFPAAAGGVLQGGSEKSGDSHAQLDSSGRGPEESGLAARGHVRVRGGTDEPRPFAGEFQASRMS